MIAISIVFAWLVLGAGAFLTLSALGRIAARHDFEAQLGTIGGDESSSLGRLGAAYGASAAAHGARAVIGNHRHASWLPSRRPGNLGSQLSRSRSMT